MNGRGGADKIKGGAGDDCLRGGRGGDKVSGGAGDDKIHVRGGRTDKVNCGPGKDTVLASARDKVRKSCERVRD
jgi:Ca2+-binding RTX toxin-like protein